MMEKVEERNNKEENRDPNAGINPFGISPVGYHQRSGSQLIRRDDGVFQPVSIDIQCQLSLCAWPTTRGQWEK